MTEAQTKTRCTSEQPAREWEHKIHFIFQIDCGADGAWVDYCRETHADDRAWADARCVSLERRHPGRSFSYRIERW